MTQQNTDESLRFVGVDLAWAVDRRHTGVAVMEGGARGVSLTDLSAELHSLEGVTQFIRAHLSKSMVVAVDASLIVNNDIGQRPCETEIGRIFGHCHASCHSTNRTQRYFDSGQRLVRSLTRHGFDHGLPLKTAKFRPGRWLIEVYPHPAMVRLFDLKRIIRYKKGTVGERRSGLRLLQTHIRRIGTSGCGLLPSECLDRLLCVDPADLKGHPLKRHEDLLDAVFCAYLAWHFWRWGEEGNEVFGEMGTGYIVVPKSRSVTPP
jgi:predicted RNase H-like nuclease